MIDAEGSAYWIAMRGLNACARMSDRRFPKGPLHASFNAHFGLDNDLDICAHVYGNDYARGDLARLSLPCTRRARGSSCGSRCIFRITGRRCMR